MSEIDKYDCFKLYQQGYHDYQQNYACCHNFKETESCPLKFAAYAFGAFNAWNDKICSVKNSVNHLRQETLSMVKKNYET